MRADPEPQRTVRNFDPQGTVMKSDARRPEPIYLLEVD
jgi:hypothetical protein